jgi:hypothetical protein
MCYFILVGCVEGNFVLYDYFVLISHVEGGQYFGIKILGGNFFEMSDFI